MKGRLTVRFAVITAIVGVWSSSGTAAPVWPSQAARISSLLSSDDVDQRRDAAAAIELLPRGSCRSLAARAVSDDDVAVRLVAAQAAMTCGAKDVATAAVPWLTERDVRLRVMACEVLRRFPRPEAVPFLARLLGDSREHVRVAAVRALANAASADDGHVPALIAKLDDPSEMVRLEVVHALRVAGDRRSVVPLLSRVQDRSPRVRRLSIRTLGELGDKRASSVLLVSLQDSSKAVRRAAARALGQLRVTGTEGALQSLLDSQDIDLRLEAANALATMHTPRALAMLVRALRAEAPMAAKHPIQDAVVSWGASAVVVLERALSRATRPNAVAGCALALSRLTGPEHLAVIQSLIVQGRIPATVGLAAIGRLGRTRALPGVMGYLGAEQRETRQAALRAVADILERSGGSGLAIDPIERRLRDDSLTTFERARLLRLLGATKSNRAVETLQAVAMSKGPSRFDAIVALGHVGTDVAVTKLVPLLKDENERLRWHVAVALARGGGDHVVRLLLNQWEHNNVTDQRAWGIAVAGSLRRVRTLALLRRASARAFAIRGPSADAAWEGVGMNATPTAGSLLAKLATTGALDERAKAAEVLALHPEQRGALRRLVDDPSERVRANAAWSLGLVGTKQDVPLLLKHAAESSIDVSANAVAALGMMGHRGLLSSGDVFCRYLAADSWLVRLNAVSSLRMSGASCRQPDPVQRLLLEDPQPYVRAAAAMTLRHLPPRGARARALRRCEREDPDVFVAQRCGGGKQDGNPAENQVAKHIWIVPEGMAGPHARARFVLQFSDGFARVGQADRRGMVTIVRHLDGPAKLLARQFP